MMQPSSGLQREQKQQRQRRSSAAPDSAFSHTIHTTQPPSSNQTKGRDRSRISNIYHLASDARGKLFAQVKREDHDLRVMVGHANLLDVLLAELHFDNEKEEQDWLNQAFEPPPTPQLHRPSRASAKAASKSLPGHSLFTDASSPSVSEPDSSSSDDEDYDGDDDEAEHADRLVYFHNLIQPPPDPKELSGTYDEPHAHLDSDTTMLLPLTTGYHGESNSVIYASGHPCSVEPSAGRQPRAVNIVDFALDPVQQSCQIGRASSRYLQLDDDSTRL